MQAASADEEARTSSMANERLDPVSFALVYQAYRLTVYRYLRARTGNEDDALDLTAVTFERAFRSLARYRAREAGVVAWLLRIARNAAIDAHRRRRPTVALNAALGPLARAAVETDRLDVERREVLDLVGRLPSDLREALLLRYAGGLTAREIGAVLGKRDAAVQKQIERGLNALREAFNDQP